VLLEPSAVALQLAQRVEVAEPLQHRSKLPVLGPLDRGAEVLEDLAVDVRPGGDQNVILAIVEDLERVRRARSDTCSR